MKLAHAQTARISRELSLLLHAGITLEEGVFLLAQEETGELQKLLKGLGQRMAEGAPLSAALEESGAFPREVSAMAAIGETSGRMEAALSHVAKLYEQRCRTSRQIREALAYPSLVFSLMLVVVAVLLIRVLPVFQQVYASLGSRLTGPAAGLLYLGILLKKALPFFLAVLAAAAVFAVVYSRNGSFREKINASLNRRFGDRGVLRKFNNARFVRGLAMGISSGLTLEEAMELARQLLSEVPEAMERCGICARTLEAGEDLAKALQAGQLLPPHQSRMLTVGLRGGKADQVLDEISQHLMEDAEGSLAAAVSRIEPAMVLAASVLVGLILLSVMLPLVNIMSTIG